MRTIAFGLLLATAGFGAGFGAGAAPALAAAQDQDHPHHEGRPAGEHPHGGGRPAAAQPARPAPAPQAQPQAPVQAQARADGGFRGGGYRGGGAPGFQPQNQQQPQPQPQQPQAFQRPDRGNRPQGFDGRVQGNADWQGRRPDGGAQVAPGSGGYRPQPGQYGYRPDRGPTVAPGSGGYRPQPGQYGYRPGGDGYQPGGNGYRPAPPRPAPGGGWNRGWRDDRSYDYRSYRVQNNFVFRLDPYYAPRGWGYGYRRFSPGFTLSAFLFDQDYWIDDPYEYRLPPAWGPYRWVRYYNDALLVDVRSGVVVDAVYGIFWQ